MVALYCPDFSGRPNVNECAPKFLLQISGTMWSCLLLSSSLLLPLLVLGTGTATKSEDKDKNRNNTQKERKRQNIGMLYSFPCSQEPVILMVSSVLGHFL